MADVSLKELLESGAHFGHQTRRWNPKMKPFIFGARGGVHIIDLTQTAPRLKEAADFARSVTARGGKVLFVGTKKKRFFNNIDLIDFGKIFCNRV